MTKAFGTAALSVCMLIVLCGFTKTTTETVTVSKSYSLQPQDERAAQDQLPQSKDTLWDTFSKTKVSLDDKTGNYSAVFPDDVKKLQGQTITISGFMLPLESSEKFKHFLLSKRTPTCFFCPPGAPNEIIEVYSDKETEWAEDLITYQGTFELIDNKEMGVFFKMSNATQVK